MTFENLYLLAWSAVSSSSLSWLWMCCGESQLVAVNCRVLQCAVVVSRNVLQSVAVCCEQFLIVLATSVQQWVTTSSVSQRLFQCAVACVAVCCSGLQCVAVCREQLLIILAGSELQWVAVSCSKLQWVAGCCIMLWQWVSVCCSVLQHTGSDVKCVTACHTASMGWLQSVGSIKL